MSGRRSRLAAVALGAVVFVGSVSSTTHAQTRLVASGTLRVEGRSVARLESVSIRPARWGVDRGVDVAFDLGGLRATGSLDRDEATLEVITDRPMVAYVGSAFTVVVRAGARLPLYAHERGRDYVALSSPGLPGIQGLSAWHEGSAALLVRPAAWPGSLPLRLRAVESNVTPAGRSCAALALHARPDVRSESLATESGETLIVTSHRGPWTELWVERHDVLLHGWTRATVECDDAGVGGLGLSGTGGGGFDPPTPVTLPRGLRFGATGQSRAAWLVVTASTPAVRYWEDDGPHYRVVDTRGGATLTFSAPTLGPRLRYADVPGERLSRR